MCSNLFYRCFDHLNSLIAILKTIPIHLKLKVAEILDRINTYDNIDNPSRGHKVIISPSLITI